MTLISMVLGAVRLVVASGAGAEERQTIGWVTFGGLGIAAIFTLFLLPRRADLARLQRELR